MARPRRSLPYENADAVARGVAGRLLAHDTYRNLRLEVVVGSADGRVELHVAGVVLGELDGADPGDALTRLRELADAVHASAGNPGDDADPF